LQGSPFSFVGRQRWRLWLCGRVMAEPRYVVLRPRSAGGSRRDVLLLTSYLHASGICPPARDSPRKEEQRSRGRDEGEVGAARELAIGETEECIEGEQAAHRDAAAETFPPPGQDHPQGDSGGEQGEPDHVARRGGQRLRGENEMGQGPSRPLASHENLLRRLRERRVPVEPPHTSAARFYVRTRCLA